MPTQVIPPARFECDILHLAFGGLGGHRAVVEELSKSIHRGGLRSGVVYVLPTNESQCPPHAPGVEFVECVRISRRGDLVSMYRVMRIVFRLRPECVIAHTHRHIPAVWFGLLLRRRRPKVVLVEHLSVNLRSMVDEIHSLLGVILSVAVVVLSNDYLQRYRVRPLLRFLRKPVAVIPNGIELSNAPKIEYQPETTFVIGMASRLIPSKKVSNLIEAVALLCIRENETEENWLLRIAGDGQDHERLQALAAARGLTSKVLFDGPIDRSDMPEWYRSIHCYVHISQGESFGMSLIEAASHGLPIVASDDVAFRQIFVPDRSIILLPSSNPEVIASVLNQLRHSEELNRLGAAAREAVRNAFSNDNMAVGYVQLLTEVNAIPGDVALQAIGKISGSG